MVTSWVPQPLPQSQLRNTRSGPCSRLKGNEKPRNISELSSIACSKPCQVTELAPEPWSMTEVQWSPHAMEILFLFNLLGAEVGL